MASTTMTSPTATNRILVSVLTSTKGNATDQIAGSHTNVANVSDLDTISVNAESMQPLPANLQQLPLLTPVKVDLLEQLLQDHPDTKLVREVIHGFRHGSKLKYKGPRTGCIHNNLTSAHQFPKLLQQCLDKEITLGRVLGPFKQPPLDNLVCSPVGMVPKKNSTKMRMITHLSYPNGNSINHHIDPRDATTSYQSFDYAVKIVAKYDHGCYMSKGDVEAVFRILPILKKDRHLLGIKFNSRFYIDICLPFCVHLYHVPCLRKLGQCYSGLHTIELAIQLLITWMISSWHISYNRYVT